MLPARQYLTMEEAVPRTTDFTYLDEYQKWSYESISWDENRQTIRGKQPKLYMLGGLEEEMGEVWGQDKIDTGYSRLGALVQLEGNSDLHPNTVTPQAVERHMKEFGDTLWYLSNFLSMYGFSLTRTIEPGRTAWLLDKQSAPRCDVEFTDEIERYYPWANYFGSVSKLMSATASIVEVRKDFRSENERQLIIASGKFLLSASHMLVTTFGTSLKEAADQNIAKLKRRKANDTLFDKSGGDDR